MSATRRISSPDGEGNPQYDHHMKTYGGPAKFGYKDFIPMFGAERFDPDEWA